MQSQLILWVVDHYKGETDHPGKTTTTPGAPPCIYFKEKTQPSENTYFNLFI
jgi:hypothetical protein